MRNAPPIHSTALHPTEYIPKNQDAERYKLETTTHLRTREQVIERRRAAADARMNDGNVDEAEHIAILEEMDREQEEIRAGWELMETKLAAMLAKYPKPITFILDVPTSIDRERVNSRLVELGLKQITQEMIRATMIEELFLENWRPDTHEGEWTAADNEAVAEDNANFLDSMWLRQEAHDQAISQWQAQEVERVLDEAAGAPQRSRDETPPKIITVREGARMHILIDRMMTTRQRLRDLAAANMDFGRRNAILLMRMHLVGVLGFEPKVPIERDPRTRALSQECVDSLREEIDDKSWLDVIEYLNSLYSLDGDEEKNSVSPLGNMSTQHGSTEPSGGLGGNGGSSTISDISPALAGASERTIDRLSVSTSDSSEEPKTASTSPMVEA